jgi:prepilin-type N-terminal cleavage/methylation domain-containing protein
MNATLSRKNNSTCYKENSRGFTLFELAVCLVIMAILTAVLVNRVSMARQEADIAAARQLVGILRAALQIKVSGLVLTDRSEQMVKFREDNPMDWLKEKPKNYLGEYYSPETSTLPKGYWYFDRKDKLLVYLLNNENTFAGRKSNLLKFKVKFPGEHKNRALPIGTSSENKSIALEEV